MASAEQVILVTGANRGLGLRVAATLAAQPGTRVVAAARRAHEAAAWDAEAPPGLVRVQLDVADAASRAALPGALRAAGVTRLHAVVHNAGVYLNGWTAEAFATSVAVNYHGAVDTTRQLLPLLAPDALVVNVTSGYGQLSFLAGSPYAQRIAAAADLDALAAIAFDPHDAVMTATEYPAYKVSKAMLNRATQLLAASGAVHCAAVTPGWVRTAMGGAGAPRSVQEGADSILWLLCHPEPWPVGGLFFQDGTRMLC